MILLAQTFQNGFHQGLTEDLLLNALAPYVKVYLLDGKKCLAKKKAKTTHKTLDPIYNQLLQFPQHYRGKILQVLFFVIANKALLNLTVLVVGNRPHFLPKQSPKTSLFSLLSNLFIWLFKLCLPVPFFSIFQAIFTCSKSIMEAPEQFVKFVES